MTLSCRFLFFNVRMSKQNPETLQLTKWNSTDPEPPWIALSLFCPIGGFLKENASYEKPEIRSGRAF